MAQPPLSAAIRQLERDLGVDLFVRTTREVRLTEAGRAFLDGARRTLADADRAAEDAKRAAAGELGRLRIAYSWSTRFETLPALGRAFRASNPDVELLGQEMWNARMPAAFGSGSIDIALSLCPEIVAELELAPIRKERLAALLPEAHPLARAEAIPLSALAGEEFVVFPREIAPRLHDAFMAIYRRAGFEPRVRNESFHTGWDLGVLAEIPAVAVAPQTVAGGLPDGIVAVAAQRTYRLTRDLPGLARRRQVARCCGIRGGGALGFRLRARRVPVARPTAPANAPRRQRSRAPLLLAAGPRLIAGNRQAVARWQRDENGGAKSWLRCHESAELAPERHPGNHGRHDGDADRPEDREPCSVADRLVEEQGTDGVDGMGYGLIRGKPFEGAWHALGRDEGAANEGQGPKERTHMPRRLLAPGHNAHHGQQPREGIREQQQQSDGREPPAQVAVRPEPTT